ncbi:hypothetical protein D6F49_22220 [Salmonella enterica]|nr:hypothetical protein [Salmonella enterica]EBX7447432.1 hypothetical protein [Salmonella enterica subsp. enterica serovar Typhimurium]
MNRWNFVGKDCSRVSLDDFICCTKGNGDGLVLNMENVTETNGNRYLKCYKNKTCLLSWL